MLVRENLPKPAGWSARLRNAHSRCALPFLAHEWLFQWMAYFLSRWALLDVVEYPGSLSVLAAVIFYYAESGDRRKQNHYQAWQVINTSQGKGGCGGRIETLNLTSADLSCADLRNANSIGVHWQKLKAVISVNIYGVRNAPPGFIDWAMAHGAQSEPAGG